MTVPIEEEESYRWLENVTGSTRGLGDPDRCVHVGDRGGDIFELFHAARGPAPLPRPHRRGPSRRSGQHDTTAAQVMRRQPIRGTRQVEVRDDPGNVSRPPSTCGSAGSPSTHRRPPIIETAASDFSDSVSQRLRSTATGFKSSSLQQTWSILSVQYDPVRWRKKDLHGECFSGQKSLIRRLTTERTSASTRRWGPRSATTQGTSSAREGGWQPAEIRIDVVPKRVFQGRVKAVDSAAGQQDWFAADVKLYKTVVSIDEQVGGLEPGMSAEVTIFAEESADEVLVVPVRPRWSGWAGGSTTSRRNCPAASSSGWPSPGRW